MWWSGMVFEFHQFFSHIGGFMGSICGFAIWPHHSQLNDYTLSKPQVSPVSDFTVGDGHPKLQYLCYNPHDRKKKHVPHLN